MTSLERHAIFFSPPPGTLPARLGAAWLGHDIDTGPTATPAPSAQIVATPRPYGFHATLRAPFRLAEGVDGSVVGGFAASLAVQFAPIMISRLVLRRGSGFFALVPSEPHPEIDALARSCTETFDPLRARLNQAELTRRRVARLTGRQAQLLARWGYPYVMDQFRFHMTLTGQIEDREAGTVRRVLEEYFAPLLNRPMSIDALSWVYQPAPEQAFRRVATFPFQGGATVI